MSPEPVKSLWADWLRRLPYRRYYDLEDRPRRLRAQFFCLLTLLSGGLYLAWLGQQALRLQTLHTYLFLVTELAAYLLLLILSLDVWCLRYHRPEGLTPDRPYTVDVFVPCCGEPLEIIRATLTAVAGLTYAPYTAYVLDDAGDQEVAALTASLGFHYYSRVRQGFLENRRVGFLVLDAVPEGRTGPENHDDGTLFRSGHCALVGLIGAGQTDAESLVIGAHRRSLESGVEARPLSPEQIGIQLEQRQNLLEPDLLGTYPVIRPCPRQTHSNQERQRNGTRDEMPLHRMRL